MTEKVAVSLPPQLVLGSASAATIFSPAVVGPTQSSLPQTINLPPECGSVKLTANHSVIICRPVSDSLADKLLATAPSAGISLIAICLSLYSIFYNTKKDIRAREQSIQDDYWLRKVVSPASIEPFVKLSSEIIAELPEGISTGTTEETVKAWYDQQHTTLIRLKPGFKTLELLNSDLLSKVEEELQAFEDELATYIGAVRINLKDGSGSPGRAASVAKLTTIRQALLQLILSHQVTLGKK